MPDIFDEILDGAGQGGQLQYGGDSRRMLVNSVLHAISGQESGGDYRVVNPDSGARGRYQIMPANWPRWSRKYLGYVADPKDPQAQDMVAQRELGTYLDEAAQHGLDMDGQVRYAAAKWYSGRGYKMDDPTPQGKYPSVQQYTYSVLGRAKRAMGAPEIQASPAAYSQGDPFDELLGDAGQAGAPQQALPQGWSRGPRRQRVRRQSLTDAQAYFTAAQQGHGNTANGLAVSHSNGEAFGMRRGAVALDPNDPYRSGIQVPDVGADAPVSQATRMRIQRLKAIRGEYAKAHKAGNAQSMQALLAMAQQEGTGLHIDSADDARALAYLHRAGKVGTPEEIEQARVTLREQDRGPEDVGTALDEANRHIVEGTLKMNPFLPLGPALWGLAKAHQWGGYDLTPTEQQVLSEGPFGGVSQVFGAIGKVNRRMYEDYKREFGYKPGQEANNAYQQAFQAVTLQPLVQALGSGLSKLTGHEIDPSMRDPIEALNQFTAGLTGVQGEDLAHDPEFQKLSPRRQQAYLDRQWYRGLIPSQLGGLLAYAPAMAGGPVSPLIAGFIGSQHAHAAYTNNVAGVDEHGAPTTYNPYDVQGSEAALAGHEAEGLVSGAAMDLGGKLVGKAFHATTPETLNPFAQNLIGRAGSAAGAVGGMAGSGLLTGHWAEGRDYVLAGLVGAAMHNSYEGKVYVASPDGRFGRVDAFGRVSIVDEAATKRGDAPVIQWSQVAPRGMSFDAVFSPEGGAQPRGLFNSHPIFAASQDPRAVGYLREALPDTEAAYRDYDGYIAGLQHRAGAAKQLAEYRLAAAKGELPDEAHAEAQTILDEFPELGHMDAADLQRVAAVLNLRGQNAARLLENPEFAARYGEQLTAKAEAADAELEGYKQDADVAKGKVGEAAQAITQRQQESGQAQQRMAELQRAFQEKQTEAKRYALYLQRLYASKVNHRTGEVEKGASAIPEHQETANRIEAELVEIQRQMQQAQVDAAKAEMAVKDAEVEHKQAEAALAHAGENLKRGQEVAAAKADSYRTRAEVVAKTAQDYLTQRREAETQLTSEEGRGALEALTREQLQAQLAPLGVNPADIEAITPVITDLIRSAKVDGLNPDASLADKAQFILDALVGSREFNDVLGQGRKGIAQLFGGDVDALAQRIYAVEQAKGNAEITPEAAQQHAESLIGEGGNKALFYDNQIWLGAKANVSSVLHEFFHALDLNGMLPFKTGRVLDAWAQSYWETNRDWVLRRNPNLADFPEGPGRDAAARAEIKVAMLEGLLRDGSTPEGTPRAIADQFTRLGDTFKDIYGHAFGTHLIDPAALPTDVRDMFRDLLGDQLVQGGARVAQVSTVAPVAEAGNQPATGNLAGKVTARGKSAPVIFADDAAREGFAIGEAAKAGKVDPAMQQRLEAQAGRMGIAVPEARRYFGDLYADMRRQLDTAVPDGDGAVFLSRRLPEPKAGDSPAMLAAKNTARRLYNAVVDGKARLQGPALQALRTDLAGVLGRTPSTEDVDNFLGEHMPANFFHEQAKVEPGEAQKWLQFAATKEAQITKAAADAAKAVKAAQPLAHPEAIAKLREDLERDEGAVREESFRTALLGSDKISPEQQDAIVEAAAKIPVDKGSEGDFKKVVAGVLGKDFKGLTGLAQRLRAAHSLLGPRRALLDEAMATQSAPEGVTRDEARHLRALRVVEAESDRQPVRGSYKGTPVQSAIELAGFRRLDEQVAAGEIKSWRRLNGEVKIPYHGKTFEPDVEITDLDGSPRYVEIKPLNLLHPGKDGSAYVPDIENTPNPQAYKAAATKVIRKAIEGRRALGDRFDVWTEGSLGNHYVAETLRMAADGKLDFKSSDTPERLRKAADTNEGRGSEAAQLRRHRQATEFYRARAAEGQPQTQAAQAQPQSIALNANFREWFGKSQAVDEQGNPKVYYHGTGADFGAFAPGRDVSTGGYEAERMGRDGSNPAGAIYLTNDPAHANKFAWFNSGHDGQGGNIMPVYVKAERPFDYENPEHVSAFRDWVTQRNAGNDSPRARDEVADVERVAKGQWGVIQGPLVQKFIRAQGYDSFYVKHSEAEPIKNLAVFSPTQVKGVFNPGAWDGTKPELLAQPGPRADLVPVDDLHTRIDEGIKNEGGVTIKPNGHRPDQGYMVSLDPRFEEQIPQGADEAAGVARYLARDDIKAALAEDPERYIGAWRAPDGTLFMDVSERFTDGAKAREVGRQRGQWGIFDLTKQEGDGGFIELAADRQALEAMRAAQAGEGAGLAQPDHVKLFRSGSYDDLAKLDSDTLDREAWGFAASDIKTLKPEQLTVKYTDDLENAQYQQAQSGLSPRAWAKTVSLKDPIEVSYDGERFNIEDGHHRYLAAKILDKPLKVELEIKANPIQAIIDKRGLAQPGDGPQLTGIDADSNPAAKYQRDVLDLYHLGRVGGLVQLDPAKLGTGTRSQETRQGIPPLKRSFFYLAGTEPEPLVRSGAKALYTTRVDTAHSPIYDLGTDPAGIIKAFREAGTTGGSEALLQQIKDAGYAGYTNSAYRGMDNVVALFNPAEVTEHPLDRLPEISKAGWRVENGALNVAGTPLKVTPEGALAQPGDAFPDFHKHLIVDQEGATSSKDRLLRVARRLQQTAEQAHGVNFPPKANSPEFAGYKAEAVRRAKELGSQELTDFVKTFGADDADLRNLVKGSFDWYHAAITRTQQHLAKIPGFEQLAIGDDGKPVNHRESRLFRFLLGSFSPGVDPDVNLRAAADLYIDYKRLRDRLGDKGANTQLPLVDVSKTVELKDKTVVGGGSYSRAGYNNIIKINRLAQEKFGGDVYKAVDWLLKPHTEAEVNEVYRYVAESDDGFHPADFRGQIDDQTGEYVFDDSMVHNGKTLGAYAFGPKVGAFISNINGLKGELTPDLWWSRTWNRWQGSLLYPKGKSKTRAAEPKDDQTQWTGVSGIPRSKPERDVMRQGILELARDLTAKTDPASPSHDPEFMDALGLTGKHVFGPSEAQSMLWYMEQQYWAKQGHLLAKSRSYDGEASALAKRWKAYDGKREGMRKTVADLWLSADPEAVRAKLAALDADEESMGPVREAALNLQSGLIKRVRGGEDPEAFVRDIAKLYGLAQPADLQLFQGKDGEAKVTPENFDEYLNRGGYVSDQHVALALGDKPAYLANVAKYLIEQRAKINEGRLTKRDVAKAYLLTLSSIQASEHGLGNVTASAAARLGSMPEMDPHSALSRFPEINPEQFWSDKGGRTVVRPEDYFARFLFTEQGQRLLDGIEQGQLDLSKATEVRGLYGNPSVVEAAGKKVNPANPGTKYSLANLDELVDALNAAGPQGPKAVEAVLRQTRGIAAAKTGFIKQLLGFGDAATVDAVEMNYWLAGVNNARALAGKPLEAAVVEHAKRLRPNDPQAARLRAWIEGRFAKVAEDPAIREQLSVEELDPNAFNTIMHHWLWDRAKSTETSHEGFYNAMRLAQPSQQGLLGAQQRAQRETLVKRAYDAVSTFTRGSMLLNPATHGTNVGGNVINRLRLDLGDLAATPLDFVASAFSKQHAKASSPLDNLRALGATFSLKDGDVTKKGGLRRAWEHLTLQEQGPQQNAPAAQQSLFKGQKLPKALANGFSALAFGTLGAEDAFFYTYSLKKNMLDLARAQALTEYRSNKQLSIRDRMQELMDSPTSEMVDQAESEALMATFQNSTVPHEMVDAMKSAAAKAPVIGSTLKFALDQLVPFSKTPSAVVVAAMDMLGGHGLRAVGAGAKWAAMLARGEAQDPVKIPEIRALQRQMVSQAGHQLVASALMSVVVMAAHGYIEVQPLIPEKDRQRAAASDRMGMGWRGGRVRIGDYTYDLTGGGPTAMAAMAAAAAGQEFRKSGSWTGAAGKALEQAAMAYLELPLVKGGTDFNEAIGDPESKGQALAASFATRAIPFSAPVGAYARQADPYERQAKTFGERFQSAIPGYREQLQPKEDPLTGGPLERKAVSPFLPFKPQQYKGGDPVLRVVADLGIEPPRPDKREGEDDAQLAARTKRTQEVWRDAIRQVLPDYVGKTGDLDDEAKKALKKEVSRRIEWRVNQIISKEFREPHKPRQPRF